MIEENYIGSIIGFVVICFVFSHCIEHETVITPILITDMEQRGTLHRFFLVKNFKRDTPSLDQYVINEFCKYKSDTAQGHFYYFFHETRKTNLKEIKKYPRVIDQYSETYDRIIAYSYNTGFVDKTEVRAYTYHDNGSDFRYFSFTCE